MIFVKFQETEVAKYLCVYMYLVLNSIKIRSHFIEVEVDGALVTGNANTPITFAKSVAIYILIHILPYN